MSIYIIHDNEIKRNKIKLALDSSNVKTFATPYEAIQAIKEDRAPSLIIMKPPKDDQFIREAKTHCPYTDFVFVINGEGISTELIEKEDSTLIDEKDCDKTIRNRLSTTFSRLSIIQSIHDEMQELKHRVSNLSNKTRMSKANL